MLIRNFRNAYLDSASRWYTVCEITGVEVGLECTDRNDELRALNFILDLFVGECADVYL